MSETMAEQPPGVEAEVSELPPFELRDESDALLPPGVNENQEEEASAEGGTTNGVDKQGEPEEGVVDEEDDDDDDDDDIQITIRDIKSQAAAPTAQSTFHLKQRSATTATAAGSLQPLRAKGIDIDQVGQINGTSIYDFNIESLEDKPWRKPGADITDYFNYGFTEDTWKIYCDRQRRLRSDNNVPTMKVHSSVVVPHSVSAPPKYPSVIGSVRYGSSESKVASVAPIDVIGGSTQPSRRSEMPPTASEGHQIQSVMDTPPPPAVTSFAQPPPAFTIPPPDPFAPPHLGGPLPGFDPRYPPPPIPTLSVPPPGYGVPPMDPSDRSDRPTAPLQTHHGPPMYRGSGGGRSPPRGEEEERERRRYRESRHGRRDEERYGRSRRDRSDERDDRYARSSRRRRDDDDDGRRRRDDDDDEGRRRRDDEGRRRRGEDDDEGRRRRIDDDDEGRRRRDDDDEERSSRRRSRRSPGRGRSSRKRRDSEVDEGDEVDIHGDDGGDSMDHH